MLCDFNNSICREQVSLTVEHIFFFIVMIFSWGTKERFWLTLAPENNTAESYMVEKVIIWSI